MKNLTLTISDISRLNRLQDQLAKNKLISTDDKLYLSQILVQIPTIEAMLFDKAALDETFDVKYNDVSQLEINLEKWRKLFSNTGGSNRSSCYLVEDKLLLAKSVISIAQFTPSMGHYLNNAKDCYEVWLKYDCSATFWLPTLEDAKQYPELYNFKGTWKEAYLLLIETLKKGWPMEEFPEELKQFLKKE